MNGSSRKTSCSRNLTDTAISGSASVSRRAKSQASFIEHWHKQIVFVFQHFIAHHALSLSIERLDVKE